MVVSTGESADSAAELVGDVVFAEQPIGSGDQRHHGERTVREGRVDEDAGCVLAAFELCREPQPVFAVAQVVVDDRHVDRAWKM